MSSERYSLTCSSSCYKTVIGKRLILLQKLLRKVIELCQHFERSKCGTETSCCFTIMEQGVLSKWNCQSSSCCYSSFSWVRSNRVWKISWDLFFLLILFVYSVSCVPVIIHISVVYRAALTSITGITSMCAGSQDLLTVRMCVRVFVGMRVCINVCASKQVSMFVLSEDVCVNWCP